MFSSIQREREGATFYMFSLKRNPLATGVEGISVGDVALIFNSTSPSMMKLGKTIFEEKRLVSFITFLL